MIRGSTFLVLAGVLVLTACGPERSEVVVRRDKVYVGNKIVIQRDLIECREEGISFPEGRLTKSKVLELVGRYRSLVDKKNGCLLRWEKVAERHNTTVDQLVTFLESKNGPSNK